jgi:putative acetyltransferase
VVHAGGEKEAARLRAADAATHTDRTSSRLPTGAAPLSPSRVGGGGGNRHNDQVSLTIRTALPSDREAILAVVRDAFATGGRDGQEEVDIVGRTWSLEAGAAGLELVAVDCGHVVGHVLGAYGDLDGRQVVGVAPVSVGTSCQGDGVGSALMTELLRRADQAGVPLVLVLGEPAYYSRFGFEPSGPLDISYPPVGPNNPYFQVRRLATYEPSYRGAFTYCWERA